MPIQLHACQYVATEWSYVAARSRPDPFNQVTLDVEITGPRGQRWLAPAYWAGGQEWRVRFAPPLADDGTYRCRSVCSDTADAGLHGQEHLLSVRPYDGDNELLRHGPLGLSDDRRHFQFRDGTPFFWLADTWWMALCRRMGWPEDFQLLAADRVRQGFTVIQIIAGLYPDMPPFDPRGANEAGYPWTPDFARINPAYFDMADLRLGWLVRQGLLPCLVGCWGYFLPVMGVEKMKQHWRYLVARYAAYPMVWCLAGEAAMPYYLSKNRDGDVRTQKAGWTELCRYVRGIDWAQHPITLHPTDSARNQVEDDGVLDFDMLQTGHGSHDSIPGTVKQVGAAVARQPRMPVLNSEVCYEGILGRSRQEIQRFMFWACLLRGACGHTYGANGIWQVNQEGKPFGASPHGGTWGNTPWSEAYRLPGGRQVAQSKRFLCRFPWQDLRPRPEWVSPHADEANPMGPCCAGIAGKLRLIYLPSPIAPWSGPHAVRQLEPGVRYHALFFDPESGQEHALGPVAADAAGSWPIPMAPVMQDLVLVLEAR